MWSSRVKCWVQCCYLFDTTNRIPVCYFEKIKRENWWTKERDKYIYDIYFIVWLAWYFLRAHIQYNGKCLLKMREKCGKDSRDKITRENKKKKIQRKREGKRESIRQIQRGLTKAANRNNEGRKDAGNGVVPSGSGEKWRWCEKSAKEDENEREGKRKRDWEDTRERERKWEKKGERQIKETVRPREEGQRIWLASRTGQSSVDNLRTHPVWREFHE